MQRFAACKKAMRKMYIKLKKGFGLVKKAMKTSREEMRRRILR